MGIDDLAHAFNVSSGFGRYRAQFCDRRPPNLPVSLPLRDGLGFAEARRLLRNPLSDTDFVLGLLPGEGAPDGVPAGDAAGGVGLRKVTGQ